VLLIIRREEWVSDRFYCPRPPQDGRFRLLGDEAKHLARVCRLGPGDFAQIFDGRGVRYETKVSAVSRDQVDLEIVDGPHARPRPACGLTLASAVPKGERFDWLVEKATELGVDRLIPLITQRSVVDPSAAKLERLRRVIVEAAKQCDRDHLMTLDVAMKFDQLLTAPPDTADRLLAHPGGLTAARWPQAASAVLAIGPEGGFTDSEVAQAQASGWSIVGLGNYRLRIETAAIAGSTLLLSQSERTRS
jgi:16S rRNA (uracil1498-N3)-methyltransferase